MHGAESVMHSQNRDDSGRTVASLHHRQPPSRLHQSSNLNPQKYKTALHYRANLNFQEEGRCVPNRADGPLALQNPEPRNGRQVRSSMFSDLLFAILMMFRVTGHSEPVIIILD